MSTIKTIATFAIIIGCFSVLYPRFLHPLVLRLTGQHSSKDSNNANEYPPGRNIHGAEVKPGERRPPHMAQQGGDIRQHMRPGPHPGMRAAAEMQRQQSQHGSGRGMMGIVLPMYAVGIVLYLVYTLVKVFNKKERSQAGEEGWGYSQSPPKLAPGYPEYKPQDEPSSSQEQPNLIPMGKEKKQELENLLLKADDKSITETEMRELQKRLEETESQMTQILKAMQLVQNKVSTLSDDAVPATSSDTAADTQDDKAKDVPKVAKSCDSSPDMESYEIVNKKSSEDARVETIRAEETKPSEEDAAEESEVTESSERLGAGSEPNGNKGEADNEGDEEGDAKDEELEGEIIPEAHDDHRETGGEHSVRHRQVPSSDAH